MHIDMRKYISMYKYIDVDMCKYTYVNTCIYILYMKASGINDAILKDLDRHSVFLAPVAAAE